MRMEKKIVCFFAAFVVLVLALSSCDYFLYRPASVYETNDTADYGIIKGNYDNGLPKLFVSSFFPQKIEEYFSDVTYHYKAKKGDTYAYEMYLEFVIQDTDKYTAFLSAAIEDKVCEPFYFDSDYQACYVADYLTLHPSSDENRPLCIENAKIGLLLFSEVEQRCIYVALGVYDGGGVNVEELGFFFNRFGIEPLEYEERTTPGVSH